MRVCAHACALACVYVEHPRCSMYSHDKSFACVMFGNMSRMREACDM